MIKLHAPAKLTRNLFITGIRDDGYHLLRSEMVSVDLTDELDLTPSLKSGLEVEDDIAWINGDKTISLDVPADKSNLVLRACETAGIKAEIKLKKRIPPGAGLGGGSSDAASILRWGNCLDVKKALALGADVPFCVKGGRALVGGVGEQITELEYEPLSFLIITPRLHVSTPAVYQAYDEISKDQDSTAYYPDHFNTKNHNDLEEAALIVEPQLAFWRDYLTEIASERPSLAGSGSSWFFELEEHRAVTLERDISQAVLDDNLIAMVKKANTVK